MRRRDKMRFERPSVPRGWELVPVGRRVCGTHRVSMHPHDKWTPFPLDRGQRGDVVTANGTFMPYGYYIRRKPKKRGRK